MKFYILCIVASILLIIGGSTLYVLFGDRPTSVAEILTPENFVGGLTQLPEGEFDTVKPSEIVELKDGHVFELEASIVKQQVGNREIKRLAYNKQIPGPILKVEKGAKITVNFTNNIDMATALHSHGLRGDWRSDGAVPVSQDPIPVGGTFTYELEFPDTGVFWYHPHVREDYQQDLGLYGNMLVSEEGYWNEVDQEEFLILDDILENGDYDPNIVTNALMGRYGDSILINDTEEYKVTVKQGQIVRFFVTNVANTRTFDLSFSGALTKIVGGDNGRVEKEYTPEKVYVSPSERYVFELMYQDPGAYPILNRGVKIGEVVVEESDSYKMSEFTKLRENPSDYEKIRSNFAELFQREPDKRLRLDIVLKDMSSSQAGMNEDGSYTIMGVKMTKQEALDHCKIMPQMQECGPLLALASTTVVTLDGKEMTEAQARQHCVLMPETEGCARYSSDTSAQALMHAHPEGIEWEDGMLAINQVSSSETVEWVIEDQDTKERNGEINWSFRPGDMVKVRVFNDGKGLHPMQHPLHFHGQRFVVLGRDGVANDNLQWKDTVLIPMGQTVDLLVDMSNPGTWMAHCHIAEHMQSGMMFNFTVN